LSVAMLAVAPPLFAQTTTNRQIDVNVERLVNTVTYRVSDDDPYVVGYKITVTNKGGNTLQNVTVFGMTSVLGTPSTDSTANFKPTTGSPCVQGTTAQKAVCTVPQMAAGTTAVFPVFFKAPVLPQGTPENTYSVQFSPDPDKGAACFNECRNDAAGSADNDTLSAWTTSPGPVALGTTNPSVIQSALTPEGGEFYTGTRLQTDTADSFAIDVSIPGQPKFSTVKLNELPGVYPVDCTARKNFVTCYEAQVFVPEVTFADGGSDWLVIRLQVDASNLLPSAKINRVLIRYDDRPEGSEAPLDLYTVGPCPIINGVAQPLTGAEYGKPCLAKSETIGGSKGKVKTPPNWLFTLLNYKNGRFPLQ
jgi:Domain of unknown function DUF11